MLHTPVLLRDITFAVVDVETTGLSPRLGDRVCEIAVVRGRCGEMVDKWSTLVHPGRTIPFDAQSIHHISDAMVRTAPRFSHIAPAFLSSLENTVLVAHNAPFDLNFLRNELIYASLSPGK